MKRIRFLSPAEIEMLDSAAYYETRVPELGTDFISTIEIAVLDLSDNPGKWPMIGKEIRRRILPRFPYSILYKIDPEEIIIVAIMHQKRRPNYWINRL